MYVTCMIEQNLSARKKGHHKMPLLYCGTNMFGQFDAVSPEAAVRNFKTLQIDGFTPQSPVLVTSNWCYAAFAAGKRLLLQGLLKDTPHAVQEVTTEENIVQICASDDFCLALLENGKLFKLLPRVGSMLQEVKLDMIVKPMELPIKRNIFGEAKLNTKRPMITHIACGTNITVAIDAENRVYSVPSEIHRFPCSFRVKQLVCGFEHALLLNTNGDIYAWGTALRGQLGKEEFEDEEVPQIVEPLAGIKITHITAGGWMSASISAFGDLYVWGYNSDGQLPLSAILMSEAKVFHLPQIATLPICNCEKAYDTEECLALKVYAGARHLILVMNCGAVYAAGHNKYGQLALKDSSSLDNVVVFSPVAIDPDTYNLEIYCGHWNTFIKKSSTQSHKQKEENKLM